MRMCVCVYLGTFVAKFWAERNFLVVHQTIREKIKQNLHNDLGRRVVNGDSLLRIQLNNSDGRYTAKW